MLKMTRYDVLFNTAGSSHMVLDAGAGIPERGYSIDGIALTVEKSFTAGHRDLPRFAAKSIAAGARTTCARGLNRSKTRSYHYA